MSPQCIKILNCLNIILVFNFIGFATYFENVTVVEAEKNFKEINNKLKVISQKDPLTNIYNRRRMTLEINNLIDLFSANKTPFSLVMADIDDFKNINDTYGHNCGDFVLVTITSIISDLLESKGHWGRWGGEEFLFLLPEMDIDTCLPIVQDIRDAIASYDFKYNGKRFSITMTFGISMYNKEMDILELINLADTALYSGKARGKGCVVVS
jgi:diguanylate cyclase (GGDEF)-like protein